ncbi:MAG: hypothetical protein M1836_005414 [Candelina mexicana]|nr:MAG: hypothetical protein M1836_005414 [Candelina mexicana]
MNLRSGSVKPGLDKVTDAAKTARPAKRTTRTPRTEPNTTEVTANRLGKKSVGPSDMGWENGGNLEVVIWKTEKPGHGEGIKRDGLITSQEAGSSRDASSMTGTFTEDIKAEKQNAREADKPGSEWAFIQSLAERKNTRRLESVSRTAEKPTTDNATNGELAKSVEHENFDNTQSRGPSSSLASELSSLDDDDPLDSTFDDETLSVTDSEASNATLRGVSKLKKRMHMLRKDMVKSEALLRAAYDNMLDGPCAKFLGWKVKAFMRNLGTPKPEQKFERFMDLPLEIRMNIYEYLLVVGKVFRCAKSQDDPRYTGWKEYESPNTQLFAVSHQFKKETENMYYSKNLFVLSRGMVSVGPLNPEGQIPYPRFLFPQPNIKDVRSLSVCFDARDMEPRSHWDIVSTVETVLDTKFGNGYFQNLPPDGRQLTIHLQAKRILQEIIWAQKFGAAFKSLELNFLQVDLSRCYCSYGCHRYAVDAATFLGPFDTKPPKRIEIIGARNMTERNAIWTNIMNVNHPHKPAVYFPDCSDATKEFDDMELDGP